VSELIRFASANSGVGKVFIGRLSTPFSEAQELTPFSEAQELKGSPAMIGSSEATPSHALADRLLGEIAAGTFNAKEIPNLRDMSARVKKLLRLCRADGEEFAIVYTRNNEFRVWSSVQTDERPGLKVKIYTFDEPRHSNLEVMDKLRGPNKMKGTVGVSAWRLIFSTLEDARTFIVSAS
jgi:hypothetical protein